MSTNISDLPDPLILQEENSSNINVTVNKCDKSENDNSSIVIIILLVVACLPQMNSFIYNLLPYNYQEDIYVTILKIILLFGIYYILTKYLL